MRWKMALAIWVAGQRKPQIMCEDLPDFKCGWSVIHLCIACLHFISAPYSTSRMDLWCSFCPLYSKDWCGMCCFFGQVSPFPLYQMRKLIRSDTLNHIFNLALLHWLCMTELLPRCIYDQKGHTEHSNNYLIFISIVVLPLVLFISESIQKPCR